MSQVFSKIHLCKAMLDVRYWILDKEIARYSLVLLAPLDLTIEMIVDTGSWILDKNLYKSRISHLVSSLKHLSSIIYHPASSVQYPVSRSLVGLRQSFTGLYPFTVTFLVFFILSFFAGCTSLTCLKKEQAPKEITYTVPKWKHIGNISSETPTATRVILKHTGNMSAATNIIQSNRYKYDKNFYKVLPFGASIYISEDAELYVNPNGGKAPDTVIIRRKPNPEYYAIKKKTYRNTHTQDDGSTRAIYEEDLQK